MFSRNLGKKIHVRGQPGGGSELIAGTLQAQKQSRAREHFIVVALDPLLLLWRGIPIAEQRREVLRLQIKQGPRRNKFGERWRSGCRCAVGCPADSCTGEASKEGDTDNDHGSLHGFTPPWAGAALGAGVLRASSRGRTTRSCSKASCRSGWRVAF